MGRVWLASFCLTSDDHRLCSSCVEMAEGPTPNAAGKEAEELDKEVGFYISVCTCRF